MVRPSIEAVIRAIRAQLDDVEAQMVGHVREHFGENRSPKYSFRPVHRADRQRHLARHLA